MRTVTWQGKRHVRVESVPDPVIQEPTDAIVRITSTNICGSDLHLYEVLGRYLEPGDILGHEAMGIVEEVGPEASSHIAPRRSGRYTLQHRLRSLLDVPAQPLRAVRDRAEPRSRQGCLAIGCTKLYGQVPGGQAEFLRVPQAQFGPIKVPHGPPDEHFVYLSDVLPAAWRAVRYADIPEGGIAVVYGLGPLGQFSSRIAKIMGAWRVFGVDLIPERLEMARRHGIEVVDAAEIDDVPAYILDHTDGRGAHGVIDAVGMEARGSPVTKATQTLASKLPGTLGERVAETIAMDRLHALISSIRTVRRAAQCQLAACTSAAATS